MICISVENDYDNWRTAARKCLRKAIKPEKILWTENTQNTLFTNDLAEDQLNNGDKVIKVSPDYLELAEAVACYDDAEKWSLLYRILFRLTYENRNLLHIESDEDVRKARLMEKAISRDVHKFHAFVRFRQLEIGDKEIFIAWHVPTHFTVKRAVPFFVRRFGAMRFSILTPKGCAHWDLKKLTFTDGVSSDLAPQNDEAEDYWLTYYSSIFNPFRLKVKAMKAEMPIRHWKTLPEARLIPEMIGKAKRLQEKLKKR